MFHVKHVENYFPGNNLKKNTYKYMYNFSTTFF